MYSRVCSEGRWRFESPLNLLLMEYPRDLTTLGLYRNINGESWYCPTRAYCCCCQSRTWHVVELSIMLCPPENNPTCFMWVVYKKIWCWPYQNVKMCPIWWILGSLGLCKVLLWIYFWHRKIVWMLFRFKALSQQKRCERKLIANKFCC